jgi:N-acetylmuramoyl-L-alanine amidase
MFLPIIVPSPTPQSAALVLVDNGHGRETPGKRSPDGRVMEWQITRAITAAVVEELQRRGVEARRLVEEDDDVPLAERVRRVEKEVNRRGRDAVILISIHINASGDGSAWRTPSGWSAYTSRGQTRSDVLAECLYQAADQVLGASTPSIRIRRDTSDGDSDFEADFYVLRHTSCTAVLTENLFMDNLDDADFLLSSEGRHAIVSLHVVGVMLYLIGN